MALSNVLTAVIEVLRALGIYQALVTLVVCIVIVAIVTHINNRAG